jgi:hypothetical protein
MSLYSWLGSPIQFDLSDDNAAAYNRVVDVIHTVPSDTSLNKIRIQADDEDVRIYNKVAAIINAIIELNGGCLPYKETALPSDYFVKV